MKYDENMLLVRSNGSIVTNKLKKLARIEDYSDKMFQDSEADKDLPEIGSEFTFEEWAEDSTFWDKLEATGQIVDSMGKGVPLNALQEKSYIVWLLGAHWQTQFNQGLPHLLRWYDQEASKLNAEVVYLYMGEDQADSESKRSKEKKEAFENHLKSMPWPRFQHHPFHSTTFNGIQSSSGVKYLWGDPPYSTSPPHLVVHDSNGTVINQDDTYTTLVTAGKMDRFPFKPQLVQPLSMELRRLLNRPLFVAFVDDMKQSLVLRKFSEEERSRPYPDRISTWTYVIRDPLDPDAKKIIEKIADVFNMRPWADSTVVEDKKRPIEHKDSLSELSFFIMDRRGGFKKLYLAPKKLTLTAENVGKFVRDFHDEKLDGLAEL
mmetsp:Transcript_3765/g.5827  ORF Transcript_3765/g.5827 Transcript_3765/m.5827 type:complete len:376 (-) Transcript_3765:45-1172(-)